MSSSDEEEEDEREPTLKYSKLTSSLASVYRSGDSSSAFQVTDDKLIVGTHNGVIHAFSLPNLKPLRSYRAHSSIITAISVSPYSPFLTPGALESVSRTSGSLQTPSKREQPSAERGSPKIPSRPPPPATTSNLIHIATASVDGLVCVSSLVDEKDVILRNYSRPVHAVALSPAFKTDRTYLSGGTAGSLILTVGGKVGTSSDANTNSAAAAASGWLGSIGLGSNNGRDTVLHSGEGTLTAINWSLTGRYVAWNNEYGTWIMHSHLEGADSDTAWKKIIHVPRPNRKLWEEMAGVWKAQTQWINTKYLESDEVENSQSIETDMTKSPAAKPSSIRNGGTTSAVSTPSRRKVERLLVGWGDTIWVIHVSSATPNPNYPIPKARAEAVHQLHFEDCIVSGLTLYTPTKLIALLFRTTDDDNKPIYASTNGNGKRGKHRSVPADIRLIDLGSEKELETDVVEVNRFERLSFSDYHLSSLYIPAVQASLPNQRGALEVIGGGLREIRDMSVNATRLFSSSASVLSGSSGGERTVASIAQSSSVKSPRLEATKDAPSALLTPGLKIFIQSSFDCLIATRRELADRIVWLLGNEDFEAAWNLIEEHPEIVASVPIADSRPSTPSKNGQSLQDFFDDETSSLSTLGPNRDQHAAVQREQERIGDMWVEKLVKSGDWARAGTVAGKTLGNSPKWDDWIMAFAQNEKFDEITPYVPTDQIKPPLPSRVYDIILGHYIEHDRLQLQELLDRWSTSLYDVSSVSQRVETYLNTEEVGPGTVNDGIKGRDWSILIDSLAKLYLADARPGDATRCYLKTKNADAAFEVVREYARMDAVAEHVYAFVLLRISDERLKSASTQELDEMSSEAIGVLAKASLQGTIEASDIVAQLQANTPASKPFLFFYLRKLWQPNDEEEGEKQTRRSRHVRRDDAETPSRMLLAPYADLVVTLFADFSQQLLGDFLRHSDRSYTPEHASDECRRHHYIPELVYLLRSTGQTKSALHLIIDELGDVPMAIEFAKDVDDESLWGDLLDYGMNKPEFIRGLLEDVGTSIDPVTLVRKIPEGLQVEGLKSSLGKLLRENEITWSISNGASRVVEAEISAVMDELRRRRERGVVFDVADTGQQTLAEEPDRLKVGKCAMCEVEYHAAGQVADVEEHLIGFYCGHIFHLSCLLDEIRSEENREDVEKLRSNLETTDRDDVETTEYKRGRLGTKIRHAQMIKRVLGRTECLTCGMNDGKWESFG